MPYKDKVKQRAHQRLWTATRRQEFFLDKICSNCGIETNLELDHVDPKTKISHKIWSWTSTRRDEELAKCQILCKACHLEKTKLYAQKRHEDPNLSWCCDCKSWLDKSSFGKKSDRWNGLRINCKACRKKFDH